MGNNMTKKEYLMSVKVIRSYLVEIPNLTTVQQSQINKIRKGLIESFLLDRCLVFFKRIYKQNSMLTSTMLETLKLITQIPYNAITHYIKQNYQYWDLFSKYFKKIAEMTPPEGE